MQYGSDLSSGQDFAEENVFVEFVESGKSPTRFLPPVGSAKPIRFPESTEPTCLIVPNPWSCCEKHGSPNGFPWFLPTSNSGFSIMEMSHQLMTTSIKNVFWWNRSEAKTYFGQSKIDLQVEGYLHLDDFFRLAQGRTRLPGSTPRWVGRGICLVPRVTGKSKQTRYILYNSAISDPETKVFKLHVSYIICVIPKELKGWTLAEWDVQ